MKNLCYALCVCLTTISAARAGDNGALQDATVLQALERIEARFGTEPTNKEDTTTFQMSREEQDKASILKGLSGDNTINIMSHKVPVKAVTALAKIAWKQKLTLKLKF